MGLFFCYSTISVSHFIIPVIAGGWAGSIDSFFSYPKLTNIGYEGPYSSTPSYIYPNVYQRVVGMGTKGNIDNGCPSPIGFYGGCLEWQRPVL